MFLKKLLIQKDETIIRDIPFHKGINLIVDETKTTPTQEIRRSDRDREAAAAIALLTGGKVQKRLPLKPTKGEIRNIQERSRKLSGGKFSISEKIAIQVLEGKISLKEAVELEKKS